MEFQFTTLISNLNYVLSQRKRWKKLLIMLFICYNNIPSVVVTKVAATASALPTQVLNGLAVTGYKWGKHLYDIHNKLSVQYFKDSGDEKTRFRRHMDKKWFSKPGPTGF